MIAKAFNAQNYRYGFNGKERFSEWEYNYDYGDRLYDGRLGRFISIDPANRNLPSISAFSYAANSPILFKDYKGKNPLLYWIGKGAVAGVIDASMQFVMNLVIYQGDVSKSFDNISWAQAGTQAAVGMLPWTPPGGRWGRAAVDAAATVSANAIEGKYNSLEGSDLTITITADFLVSYVSSAVADATMKKAMPHIGKFLAKTGKFSSSYLQKLTGFTYAMFDKKKLDDLLYDPDIKAYRNIKEELGPMLAFVENKLGSLDQVTEKLTRGVSRGSDFNLNGIDYDVKKIIGLDNEKKMGAIITKLRDGVNFVFDVSGASADEVTRFKTKLDSYIKKYNINMTNKEVNFVDSSKSKIDVVQTEK